ncbi:helix-turn-helix transcriptional regulator [Leptolyngbya sp. FACHB-261]|uniref:helix-turn-helix transcriptional regulator n=1 Tax=Leptolyngbya sp. FACHB-261 TaxID=2692806 RepID=UPI001688198B|nr:helix-turn-helix transcriptional regulator [Leptolyngbya sp. FACHB-261]MBD2099423.1 winged helix-turn-helix transcriptional regulator [Leptolyngbya sp. FACHB-261]
MDLDQLLYQAILEEFGHGVLIITPDNHLVYSNRQAHNICQQLASNDPHTPSIPKLVWYACECLIRAQADSPGKRVIVDYSISPDQKVTVRITARWLEVASAHSQNPTQGHKGQHVLVILESSVPLDAEVIRAVRPDYGFTPREAEVWSQAKAGKTYRQIAEELYISLNTVKKHMKSALSKERCLEE